MKKPIGHSFCGISLLDSEDRLMLDIGSKEQSKSETQNVLENEKIIGFHGCIYNGHRIIRLGIITCKR